MNAEHRYEGVPQRGHRVVGVAPWICVSIDCQEARPGEEPEPRCPACGCPMMRGGPFLHLREVARA